MIEIVDVLDLLESTGDADDTLLAARLRGVLDTVTPVPSGLAPLNHSHAVEHGVRYVTPEGVSANDGLSWETATILEAALEEDALTRASLIRMSPGRFYRTTTALFPDDDPVPSIQGAGPIATKIIWDTDGGTCFKTQSKGTHYLRGLAFKPGTGKPDCWYDASADTAQDYGDDITDVFFADWNTTTGEAAVKLGFNINTHMSRVRFGGGKGPAVIAKGMLGVIDISQFTVDSASAEGQFEGLLRIDYTQGQRMTVRIASGRVECSGVDYAAPRALVHLTSGSGWPVSLLLENIQVDLGNITQDHVLFHNSGTGFPTMNINTVTRWPREMTLTSGPIGDVT